MQYSGDPASHRNKTEQQYIPTLQKVKKTEMSILQEEFVWRGLRLAHDVLDQMNPVINTCIGYTVVLGAKIFTEMEGMVEEVSHLRFPVQDIQLTASLAGQTQ